MEEKPRITDFIKSLKHSTCFIGAFSFVSLLMGLTVNAIIGGIIGCIIGGIIGIILCFLSWRF